MEELLRCRNMEAMCRQRAIYDPQRGWEWLANAEKWKNLADEEALTSEERNSTRNDGFQKSNKH
jgi:hypothetical protein